VKALGDYDGGTCMLILIPNVTIIMHYDVVREIQ
jgi:hypothetical protein